MKTSFRSFRTFLIVAIGALSLPVSPSSAQYADQKNAKPSPLDRFLGIKRDPNGGWLFAGSKNDGKGGVYFAISKDGYHWKTVNDGRPMLMPSQRGEVIRDPFVQRAPDGSFRMVWTWSLGAPAVIGYASSGNLVFWSEQRALSVAAAIPAVTHAWTPTMYYEPDKKDWLILWSSALGTADHAGGAVGNRIYATTTKEFKHFTPARLFFDPGYEVTDASLVPGSPPPATHYLLFKDERAAPQGERILAAKAPTLEGPWQELALPLTDSGSGGPAAIAVPGGYLLYYDHYGSPSHYTAAFTTDLQHASDATSKVNLPPGLHHGSLLHIETSEYNLLWDYHQRLDSGSIK